MDSNLVLGLHQGESSTASFWVLSCSICFTGSFRQLSPAALSRAQLMDHLKFVQSGPIDEMGHPCI